RSTCASRASYRRPANHAIRAHAAKGGRRFRLMPHSFGVAGAELIVGRPIVAASRPARLPHSGKLCAIGRVRLPHQSLVPIRMVVTPTPVFVAFVFVGPFPLVVLHVALFFQPVPISLPLPFVPFVIILPISIVVSLLCLDCQRSHQRYAQNQST